MPRKIELQRIASSTLLLAAVFCLLQGVLTRISINGIVLRGRDYNAGIIKPGTLINHDIRLFNISRQSVQVSTTSSCGCAVANIAQDRLEPFGSMVVKVEVATRKGMKLGKHQESLTLLFRSGQEAWQQTASVQFVLR